MKGWVIAAALAATAAPADARLTETAKVRYDTDAGPSSWQQTDVTFFTGTELNQLTHSLSYNAFKNYAAVYFGVSAAGQTEVAVIRLDSPLMLCGLAFESSCLPFTGKMSGVDQQGRGWEVCTGWIC